MAADVVANGAACTRASVSLPRRGPWHADLVVDSEQPEKFTGAVEINLGEGALVLSGTATRSGGLVGTTHVRVVGGKGGLGKAIGPKFYRAVPARIPLLDALTEGGEALAASSSYAQTGVTLDLWTRLAGTVSDELERLVRKVGGGWRVLPDGSVWVGEEAWPAAQLEELEILDRNPADGRVELASAAPVLQPGTTLEGKRVTRVEHLVEPGKVRTFAWLEGPRAPAGDAVRAALAGIVDRLTNRVDLFARYPCKVISQAGDGTLELVPDLDKRLPGLTRVPIRYPHPAITVKVAPGTRCLVGWENGDPAKPFASDWETDGTMLELHVTASQKVTIDAPKIAINGGQPLARVGDLVQGIGVPPGAPFVGRITTGSRKATCG